jgi:hypothetical protein
MVGMDGCVSIETDGRSYELPYEVKTNIDRRDHLLSFKSRHEDKLLITRSLTPVMANQCRELDIQFLDQSGNCFLRQPGLFVFVSGSRELTKEKRIATHGLTPAALRLVFAVLTRPSILNTNVRNIAEVASISHGAAGAALIALEEMGFLNTSTSGRRLLAMPERWLDAWTEGYLGRIRPKLERLRMSSLLPLTTLFDRITPQMREVALGGEAAAAHLNMGLKPGALTLYVDFQDPLVVRSLVQEFKLHRDANGSVELVSMFWNTRELPCFPTVPDVLIYADLVGTGDQRTMETANALRKLITSHVATEA